MTPARTLTVRPGFVANFARQWIADAARCEMALCTLIAFWLGFILTLIACH
ncbi:hypothetical protein [Pleomorphomonas koreensis]|uniref:hypothetical protein n=1 Tax=Pleomorphomonas koreensis TaxID=257440 RepID=UPI0003FF46FB|nr:hypothetical protein [Pleomorphomonas koreensis]